MSAGEIAARYLDAFASGDSATTRTLLADEFTFTGPMAAIDGADAFITETAPLASMVDGHHVLRMWEDGNEVCVVFDLNVRTPAGAGSVLMSEWLTVVDGLVTSSRLVFDTADFAALMPSE